jgi:NADH-quinone oxidoreductase subunit L
MRITGYTFIVGWLAIAGLFPLAGFWSKDEILAKAWFNDDIAFGKALWAIGLVTALLTAFYMTRQVRLVFFGPERFESEGEHAVHPHESPWLMTLPLLALAGLSIVGGFLSLPFTNPNLEFLVSWLDPVFEDVGEIHATSFSLGLALSLTALVIAAIGLLAGWRLYVRGLRDDGTDPVDGYLGTKVGAFFQNAWYVDAGISRAVDGPVHAFARGVATGVDRLGIDGAVNGVGSGFRFASLGLRRLQSGLVRNYALGVTLGALGLVIWFATRVSW